VAIAGHRTTWLHPFYNLQAVRPGDPIVLTVVGRRFVYTTLWVRAVSPSDVSVVGRARGWLLTLTTCTPRFSASERLVLRAALDVGATRALVAPAPASSDRAPMTRFVVTRLASSRPVLPTTPAWVLAAWAGGVAALVLLASILVGRSRTALLLLVPAAACCFEAYGAAVRLLPASW
jgi:sortase A